MPNKPHSSLPAHMAAEAGPLKSSGTHGELSRSSERSSFDRPSARGKSTQEIIEELKAREDVGSREAFRLFDKDGDGIITKDDLCEALFVLGQEPTEGELKDMIREVDANGDGRIDYEEFLLLMARRLQDAEGSEAGADSIESLKHAFKVFDKDGDGFISAEELRLAMAEMGQELSSKEAEDLLKEADSNRDGKLDFKEFAKFIDSST